MGINKKDIWEFGDGYYKVHITNADAYEKIKDFLGWIIKKNAFGFAMAPIMDASLNSDNMRQVTDEKTGLTMRLEVSRQEKQWKFDYDILYGATLLRPEAACRILG